MPAILFLFINVHGSYQFKTWNTENGLPQNTVHSIVQTPDGYLWLATFDGLARFDGIRFKIFKKSNTPELPTNRLAGLLVDSAERLWILSEDSKTVVAYENGKFSAFIRGKDFETDDLHQPWREQTEMRFRSGDDEYAFEDGRFVRRSAADERPLPRVFWDEERTVWINEKNAFYGGRNGELKVFPKGAEPPFSKRRIYSRPLIEIDGSSWFLMPFDKQSRIARFKDGALTVFPLVTSDTSVLARDRGGNLWLGDFSEGLTRIDAAMVAAADPLNFRSEDISIERGLADSRIRNLFLDRDSNLWVATEKGLQLINDDQPVTVYSKATGLPSENIYSVVEDRAGTIWFGAWPNYLIGYDNGKFSAEPFGLVTALFADRNARFWVGSSNVSYREGRKWVSIDRQLGFETKPPGEVTVISQDRDGNMWFGSNTAGIVRYAGGSRRSFMVRDGLPGNSVTSFLQSSGGTIWVGTSAGLARYEDESFVAFTMADGLAGDFVRSLYEDGEGTLWIGSYDSGLTRYKDGTFVKITSRDGLFSDGAFCILEDDDGWFWINSNQGIYRARRSELNDFADGKLISVNSVSYGPQDGLLNVEGNGGKQPAGLKSSDGRLWFPTAGGIAVIDPRRLRQTSPSPPAMLEEVLIDQQIVDTGKGSVRIEPGQSALDISFTAVSFRGAERTRFRYRLEGLDENWTEAGTRRTAYFSHIPFGEYTFRVIAANQDGAWNDLGATIKVIVVPPFYRTSWFYALASLVGFGIVGFVYLYRVRQLLAANKASAEFARRLIDSQEDERRRIALELHDSLGQSLAVIRNRALMSLSTPDEHQRLIDQMQEISEASAAALQETREIAHNLHPEQLEHLGLPAALSTLVDSIETATDIEFSSKIHETVAAVSGDEAINLYRIAQECISNIIKHSDATRAEIALFVTEGRLVLRVEDNGRGAAAGNNGGGLGLKGISERSNIIGAELEIQTAAGKGTRITISLPYLRFDYE